MDQFRKYHTRRWVAVILSCITFIGLLSSRSLLSSGMISLGVLALLDTKLPDWIYKKTVFKPFPLIGFIVHGILRPKAHIYLKRIAQSAGLVLFTMVAFPEVISAFYSENLGSGMRRLQAMLGLFLLPLAFASLKNLSKAQVRAVFICFTIVMLGGNLFYIAPFLSDLNAFTNSLIYGIPLNTPINHVRFSLLTAIASSACLYYIMFELRNSAKHLKVFFIFTLILLVVSLHLFGVRTGIVTFYAGGFILLIYLAFQRKYYWQSAVGMGLFIAVIAGLFNLPSVQKKVGYAMWELKEYQAGRIVDGSDQGRIRSWQAGLDIGKANFWLGTGSGDLWNDTKLWYQKNVPSLPQSAYKKPHNQFIWTFATSGIVGLMIFSCALIGVFVFGRLYLHPLACALFIMVNLTFLVEATLGTQHGIAAYSFFILIFLNHLRKPAIE